MIGDVQGTFHIIMHKAEEGGFWAEALELPGCMSQGETEDEVLANIRDAILGIIKSYVDDNEPVPLERSATVRILHVSVPA